MEKLARAMPTARNGGRALDMERLLQSVAENMGRMSRYCLEVRLICFWQDRDRMTVGAGDLLMSCLGTLIPLQLQRSVVPCRDAVGQR